MSPKKPSVMRSYPKWHPAELEDAERLVGRTFTGPQFCQLRDRWYRLRDERMAIEDRVEDLLRTRAHRRAVIHKWLVTAGRIVLVLLVSLAIGLFARSLP